MYISTEIKKAVFGFQSSQSAIDITAIAQHLLDTEIGLTLASNEEMVIEALHQLGLMTRFTDNEKAIMHGTRDNEFADAFDGGMPWVFAVIAESGLDPKVARGALASLVKKNILIVDGDRADDMTVSATAFGSVIAKHTKF